MFIVSILVARNDEVSRHGMQANQNKLKTIHQIYFTCIWSKLLLLEGYFSCCKVEFKSRNNVDLLTGKKGGIFICFLKLYFKVKRMGRWVLHVGNLE